MFDKLPWLSVEINIFIRGHQLLFLKNRKGFSQVAQGAAQCFGLRCNSFKSGAAQPRGLRYNYIPDITEGRNGSPNKIKNKTKVDHGGPTDILFIK
jgi:hypothetical protein